MREEVLYPWVERYLNTSFEDNFRPKLKQSLHKVAITASTGVQGAGQWTRPDLALFNLWKHEYSTSYTLDLYSFEVKTENGCDLTGVHEALAHTRSVHYSYLTWHYPSKNFDDPKFKIIEENCLAYGVGLITFGADDPRTFIIHHNARRIEPDAALVSEFIETRFSKQHRDTLLEWLRWKHWDK